MSERPSSKNLAVFLSASDARDCIVAAVTALALGFAAPKVKGTTNFGTTIGSLQNIGAAGGAIELA